MNMYKNIQDILQVLWNDEELLRLLHYKPRSIRDNRPDPLDKDLPNILESDISWAIRNSVIMLTPKDDDLLNKSVCKLFVYLGDRTPKNGNFKLANQEIKVDVLCHSDIENGDMRSSRIADRLNAIFVHSKIVGISKVEFNGMKIITRVPSQFVGYTHEYQFLTSKGYTR